jgi:hypothetical protein
MLSLFKKRTPATDPTFKTRVERFWDWYAAQASRFLEVINNGQCPSLANEVSSKMHELLPGFAWVFGPGENKISHSFTISGEGMFHRQLLAIYCVSRAPKLDGWTFYASRQPGSIDGICLDIGGRKFDPLQLWIAPQVNHESQKVDITVWHPFIGHIDSNQRLGPVFLLLDEVLGEFGTGQWVGEIKLNDKRLSDAIPLKELYSFVKKVEADTGWKKLPPGEQFFVFELKQPHDRFLRSDIIVGNTVHPRLVTEYLHAEGRLEDPLCGTGADYVFVSFDSAILPAGQQTDARARIEEALEAALQNANSGRVLGAAFGTRFAYIDLLLYDGTNSLEIVKPVLSEQGLPPGTAINFFAKEKAGQQIML